MNYLHILDHEITKTRQHLADLEAARRVMISLQEPALAATDKRTKTLHKKTAKKRLPRQLDAVRTMILDVLHKSLTPQLSRDIISQLNKTMPVSDSTVWKALKQLKDEGLITWDDETRTYSALLLALEVAS